MIYCTGDKHGDYDDIIKFCEKFNTSTDDIMIVLGDNGLNFYNDRRDSKRKEKLSRLPITLVLIKGNHDMRPGNIKSYQLTHVENNSCTGDFWIEKEYPNLLFTKEYGEYIFGKKKCYVIGGAYSVDKDYRLEMQWIGFKDYKWFHDEQLTLEEMDNVADEITDGLKHYDYVLTHTCPLKHKPFSKLSGADETMETWMDAIEDNVSHDEWYCGHWHIDKIDSKKFRFVYHDIIELT